MKSYTDLEQSKKLIELGIDEDTADMNYCNSSYKGKDYVGKWTLSLSSPKFAKTMLGMSVTDWNTNWEVIPAWSLASLLSVLPYHIIINNTRYEFSMYKGLNRHGETYMISYNIYNTDICLYETNYYNNPVDACYEMILKLHEFKVL